MLSEFETKTFSWMSNYIKNLRLSKTLDENLEKTNALAAATKAMAALSREFVQLSKDQGFENNDLNLLLKVLSFQDELEGLIDNNLGSFEALSDELKQDKKFILLALMSGVDGRLLTYTSPFVMFIDAPQAEHQFDEWYRTAEFDDVFFSFASGFNEHSFYGLWSNPKIEKIVADGYKKFDLWENESAWVSASNNPKFLRYHDVLSLGLIMDEWKGTAVEQTLKSTISNVISDLPEFARTILPDYFKIIDIKQVENQFNINFNDVYFELIGKGDQQLPALYAHDQSVEIYNLTDLKDFEDIIRFIVSHGK